MSEARMPPAADRRRTFLACLRAHQACEDAVAAALREGTGGDELVSTLLDCADVCRTTARYVRTGSPLVRGTAGVCAELCERAAEACAPLTEQDAIMGACVDACRRCAGWCRRLADHPLERAA